MILVDAGFLYALLDKDDAWHVRASAASEAIKEKWITTWPVLTEAVHLITRWLSVDHAIALMQDIAEGDIALWDIAPETCASSPPMNATSAPNAGNPDGRSKTCLPEPVASGTRAYSPHRFSNSRRKSLDCADDSDDDSDEQRR